MENQKKNIRIEKIFFEEIGVFKSLELDFSIINNDDKKAEIHILTGANGTGKTTILEGLTSAFKANIISFFQKKWNYQNRSKKKTPYVLLNNELAIQIDYIYPQILINPLIPKEEYPNKIEEWEYLCEQNLYKEGFSFINRNEQFRTINYAAFAYSGYRKIKYEKENDSFQNPLIKAIDFDKGDFDFSIFSSWALEVLNRNAHALKNNHKKLAKETRKTMSLIESVIEKVTGFQFKFDVNYVKKIELIAIINGKKISIESLPDGLVSILTWLGDLLFRLDRINWKDNSIPITEQNFLLFLDEIEVHLHPQWQRKILPLLQDLFPHAQVFVSTHSPFVVNSVSDAWVYKLDLDEEGYAFIAKKEKTNPAKSISLILNEIFDVKEEFGWEISLQLAQFYNLRNEVLENGETQKDKLLQIAKQLMKSNSVEIQDIVSFEIRQINRRKNTNYRL